MELTKDQKGIDFQTPVEVAKYMVSLLPAGITTVLEPTPGIGNIVRELERSGYQVTAPEDYFLLPPDRWDAAVLNPPFSAKYAYLDNAEGDFSKYGMRLGYKILTENMEMSDNVIALMPWFTISDSDVRLRHLKSYGLISVTALPRKTFQYARIQTCVLQLQKGFTGPTQFIVYDLKDKQQLPTLF
ncbi:hypothetical protein [Chitinophaga varians]|uniref:hypothetical protein n=1 Tax=Chitinophaga varians TaxID=2202339 RepID=UPI00165FE9C6|nr:hypothetical protein [Chitinophaga varians]MBC9913144.1 hypothetical protein [Chitinophaga varians]